MFTSPGRAARPDLGPGPLTSVRADRPVRVCRAQAALRLKYAEWENGCDEASGAGFCEKQADDAVLLCPASCGLCDTDGSGRGRR